MTEATDGNHLSWRLMFLYKSMSDRRKALLDLVFRHVKIDPEKQTVETIWVILDTLEDMDREAAELQEKILQRERKSA